jgi:hypothetical protein
MDKTIAVQAAEVRGLLDDLAGLTVRLAALPDDVLAAHGDADEVVCQALELFETFLSAHEATGS